jgi:hypothetical protein
MSGQAIRMRGQGIVGPLSNIAYHPVHSVSTITGTIRDRPSVDRAETGSKTKKKSSKKTSKKKGSFKSLKFNF